jgi:hypothetical protein
MSTVIFKLGKLVTRKNLGLLSDFQSVLVLFHADCVKHTSNGILFEQFQIFAVRASQTLLTRSHEIVYILLAAKRHPSSLVRPAIMQARD